MSDEVITYTGGVGQERNAELAAHRVGPTIAGITEQTSYGDIEVSRVYLDAPLRYSFVEMQWSEELSFQVARVPEPEADEPMIIYDSH